MKHYLPSLMLSACLAAIAPAGADDMSVVQSFPLDRLEHRTDNPGDPAVYFTRDISPAGLQKVYKALGRIPAGRVAVKISTGEKGNPNHLQPALIGDLVREVKGNIVECNTAYHGARFDTVSHMQVAREHGYTDIATVDIMDAEGDLTIPVKNGVYLKEDIVGSHLQNYDFMMVLTHFKGHAMGGFGGSLKNISIGVASKRGKNLIHSSGHYDHDVFGPNGGNYLRNDTDEHLEFICSMAEAAKAVADYFGNGERMIYINVLNRLSVDCDCDGNPAEPDMHDIGIIASLDPVAADQAGIDLVFAAPDSKSVRERVDSRRGRTILDHAQKIGLGETHYRLINVDGPKI